MSNVIGVGQLSLLDLNDAIVSGTPPANPTVGMLWVDESSNPNLLKKWNGSQWEVLGELDPNLSETISDIQETLGNMANDNILDVNERQVIKDKLTEILGYVIADTATTLPTNTTLDSSGKGGFYTVRQSALAAGIQATDPKYTAVATKYTDLKVYLEGLTPIKPWDTSTANKDVVINVDKATFRDKWLQYYNAVNDLATATAQKLKENVDNVTVGGTNYASNGDFSIALNKGLWANHYVGSVKEIVDISTEEPPFQFALHVKNTSNINGGIFTPILWSGKMAESLVNKEVTVSFWLKYQNIVQGSQSHNLGRFGELVIEGEKADGTKVYSYPRVLYISGTNMTWQKYSATFKLSLPSGAVKLAKISFKHGLEGCQGEFWTTGIKIEFGNKVTDWSPCPFDIQDRLTKAEFKLEDDQIVSVVTSSQTYVNTINNLQTNINTANSKIDNLQIGGRNLLRNSHIMKNTNGNVVGYPFDKSLFVLNEDITVSFDARTSESGVTGYLDSYFRHSSAGVQPFSPVFQVTNDWKRYSYTIKVTQEHIDSTETISFRSNASVAGNTTGVKVDIKNVKIERGNRATDWTPAPEDLMRSDDFKDYKNKIGDYITIKRSNFATFTRSSIAYKNDGTQLPNNEPRLETGKFSNAILIEEGTTNAVTNPLAETDLTGIVKVGAATGTVERSTTPPTGCPFPTAVRGNITAAGDFNITFMATNGSESTSGITVSPNTTYTISAWVYIPSTSSITSVANRPIEWKSDGTVALDGGTSACNTSTKGQWIRLVRTITTTANTAKITLRFSGSGTGEFYVTGVQLEQKSYATSFVKGSRSPEILTIPTSGVVEDNKPFTIECWAKSIVDKSPNWRMLFSAWNKFYVGIMPNSKKVRISWVDANGAQQNVESADLNIDFSQWHHWAFTYDGSGKCYLYINQVLVLTANTTLPKPFPANIDVGRMNTNAYYWNGWIDDLRVSSICRTGIEILNYDMSKPLPVDEFTTAYMSFDQDIDYMYSEPSSLAINLLENRLSTAEEKITDSAIINTVTQSVEMMNLLDNKANVEDLGNYATKDDLDQTKSELNQNINDAINNIDFTPYVTKTELQQTSQEIDIKFSKSGGINLIRNSAGHAGLDFWTIHSKNLVLNSALRNGTANFSLSTGWSLDTSFKYQNFFNTFKCVVTDRQSSAWYAVFTNFTPATAGEQFTASWYVYIPSNHGIDAGVSIEIEWYNDTSRISVSSIGINLSLTNQWRRFSVTGVAPEGTTKVRTRIHPIKNGSFWVTLPQLERGTLSAWSPSTTDSATDNFMVTSIQNDELESKGIGSGFNIFTGGKIIQSVPVIEPNQPYTLSALVKSSSTANGYMRIYDGDVTSSTYQEVSIGSNKIYEKFKITITPTSNIMTIELCSTYDYIIFTGVMLNIGDIDLQWQLSTDEVYNSTIQMNMNGIKVSHSQNSAFTVMTPEKFAGYYDVNGDGVVDETAGSVDEVFRMDQDEFVMKKANVKQEITMGGIKIVLVSGTYNGWAFVATN